MVVPNLEPDNKAHGVRHTSLRSFLNLTVDRHDFLKFRIKVLFWEKDIELVEVASVLAVIIVFSDMLNNFAGSTHNRVYDGMFNLFTKLGVAENEANILWMTVLISISIAHLAALVNDNIKARTSLMFVITMLLLVMAISMWGSVSYSLTWKFMLFFTITSGSSYIRLRKQRSRDEVRKVIKSNDGLIKRATE